MNIILKTICIIIVLFLLKIAIDIIISYIEFKLEERMFFKEYNRKVNVVKSLELYWLDNRRADSDLGIDQEMKISEEICRLNLNRKQFNQKLKESQISYCYDIYLIMSKSNYPKLMLKVFNRKSKNRINNQN